MIEPLTPRDCDLRDFPRMMIDITRLRQSAFDATPDDSAWRAGFNLWFSAWHSVPAGSLDDDEASLTKAAGLGRDVRTWRKVKAAALRGFLPCADGRLYHETVCELALEAWIEKLVQRLSSGAGNAKRWGTTFNPAEIEGAIDHAVALLTRLAPNSKSIQKARRRHSKTEPVGNPGGTDPVSHRDLGSLPTGSQEKGEGTGTLFKDADASFVAPPPTASQPARQRKREYPAEFEAAWKAYPHHPGRSSKPDAADEWRRLPAEERATLPGCISRFAANVETTCGGKGAPDMARWLKHGKHLAWASTEPASRDLVADVVSADDLWSRRIETFKRNLHWNRLEWGPAPGQPDCQVSPEIQRHHGFEPKPQRVA